MFAGVRENNNRTAKAKLCDMARACRSSMWRLRGYRGWRERREHKKRGLWENATSVYSSNVVGAYVGVECPWAELALMLGAHIGVVYLRAERGVWAWALSIKIFRISQESCHCVINRFSMSQIENYALGLFIFFFRITMRWIWRNASLTIRFSRCFKTPFDAQW